MINSEKEILRTHLMSLNDKELHDELNSLLGAPVVSESVQDIVRGIGVAIDKMHQLHASGFHPTVETYCIRGHAKEVRLRVVPNGHAHYGHSLTKHR